MKWRGAIGVFLAALAILAAGAQAEDWTFGAFSIRWPDGFIHIPRSNLQFLRRDGVAVTLKVLSHDDNIGATDERTFVDSWTKYAQTKLPEIAAGNAAVISIPLTEETLPSHSLSFSIASDEQILGQQHFGLFFVVISPRGRMAQIVVEGNGFAKDHIDEFKTAVETAVWRETDAENR
jgi:hypothetical protein